MAQKAYKKTRYDIGDPTTVCGVNLIAGFVSSSRFTQAATIRLWMVGFSGASLVKADMINLKAGLQIQLALQVQVSGAGRETAATAVNRYTHGADRCRPGDNAPEDLDFADASHLMYPYELRVLNSGHSGSRSLCRPSR